MSAAPLLPPPPRYFVKDGTLNIFLNFRSQTFFQRWGEECPMQYRFTVALSSLFS